MNATEKRKLNQWFIQLVEETLEASELEALEQQLRSDPEAMQFYVQWMSQECSLRGKFQHSTETVSNHRRMLSFKPWTWGIAAMLCLGFSLYALINWTPLGGNRPPKEVMAFMRSDATHQPQALGSGKYHYKHGQYVLDFVSGAQIHMEAPVRFDILDSEHIHVYEGEFRASVTPPAHGFRISSANSAFVDLGTDFTVDITKDNQPELTVHEGLVVANTVNPSGYSERVEIIEANEAVKYNPIETRFERIDMQDASSPSSDELAEHFSKPIPNLENFAQSIATSQPTHYWSFDELTPNGFIDNYSQRVLQPLGKHIKQASNTHNGALYFGKDSAFTGVKLEGTLAFEVNEPFSLEFIFNPNRINRASILSLFDPNTIRPNGSTDHFLLIETMAQPDWFSHRPACMRTVYRPIAGPGSKEGINSFVDKHYIPGEWSHFVLTFDGKTFTTYIDGEPESQTQLREDENSPNASYAMVLGQMTHFNFSGTPESNFRPFQGWIDELAIYKRPLTDQEISTHYREFDKAL